MNEKINETPPFGALRDWAIHILLGSTPICGQNVYVYPNRVQPSNEWVQWCRLQDGELPPHGTNPRDMPSYCSDDGACLRLLDDMMQRPNFMSIMMAKKPDGYVCSISFDDPVNECVGGGCGWKTPTLREAVTEACWEALKALEEAGE